MTLKDWSILFGIAACFVSNLVVTLYVWNSLNSQLDSARKLISAETERKQAHSDAFERLTDPDAIMADMERGADIIEARNAHRLTKPREDAGPPARVWRPKVLRGGASRRGAWYPPRT
jgi:hypothetical protein